MKHSETHKFRQVLPVHYGGSYIQMKEKIKSCGAEDTFYNKFLSTYPGSFGVQIYTNSKIFEDKLYIETQLPSP